MHEKWDFQLCGAGNRATPSYTLLVRLSMSSKLTHFTSANRIWEKNKYFGSPLTKLDANSMSEKYLCCLRLVFGCSVLIKVSTELCQQLNNHKIEVADSKRHLSIHLSIFTSVPCSSTFIYSPTHLHLRVHQVGVRRKLKSLFPHFNQMPGEFSDFQHSCTTKINLFAHTTRLSTSF